MHWSSPCTPPSLMRCRTSAVWVIIAPTTALTVVVLAVQAFPSCSWVQGRGSRRRFTIVAGFGGASSGDNFQIVIERRMKPYDRAGALQDQNQLVATGVCIFLSSASERCGAARRSPSRFFCPLTCCSVVLFLRTRSIRCSCTILTARVSSSASGRCCVPSIPGGNQQVRIGSLRRQRGRADCRTSHKSRRATTTSLNCSTTSLLRRC